MIKEIAILTVFVVCCASLPASPPLHKVMAVVVQPGGVKAPANLPGNAEIFATAETGWRKQGYGGGYGQGAGFGFGGGWRRGAGGNRGGYYGGGWKNRGGYHHG